MSAQIELTTNKLNNLLGYTEKSRKLMTLRCCSIKSKKQLMRSIKIPVFLDLDLYIKPRKFNSEKNSGPITNTKKRLVQAFLLFIHHK